MLQVSPSGLPLRRSSVAETSETTSEAATDDPRLAPADKDARATARTAAALLLQQQRFNEMVIVRSELEREQEALDALVLAQVKHEDEMLKEWIRLA